MESCAKHPHEKGVAICRRCGGAWCSDCLIYSFGERKPPFCMSCAMVAGGVRTSGTMAAMPRSMVRARMKAIKVEAKLQAKATRAAEAQAAAEEAEPKVQEHVATASTDWGTPWWEDRQPTLAD
jgi:hypothetical protein